MRVFDFYTKENVSGNIGIWSLPIRLHSKVAAGVAIGVSRTGSILRALAKGSAGSAIGVRADGMLRSFAAAKSAITIGANGEISARKGAAAKCCTIMLGVDAAPVKRVFPCAGCGITICTHKLHAFEGNLPGTQLAELCVGSLAQAEKQTSAMAHGCVVLLAQATGSASKSLKATHRGIATGANILGSVLRRPKKLSDIDPYSLDSLDDSTLEELSWILIS